MLVNNDILEGIRSNVWSKESTYISSQAPTMLSSTELQMCEWLGRTLSAQKNTAIVDAGCFLGGSTCALAEGVASNANGRRIHSYDMFRVPNDKFSQGLIGRSKVGESVYDLFLANTSKWGDLIVSHSGDFLKAIPPVEPISCLFIDIAKTWQLNDVVIRKFFPLLIPGASIVVQQDLNDHSCPWVNLTMEYFSNYFQLLTDDSSSRIFLYNESIPQDMLETSIRNDLSFDTKLALMDSSINRSSTIEVKYLNRVSKAWLLFEFIGKMEALVYLEGLKGEQPWKGSYYVDLVIGAMQQLEDTRGLDSYIDKYFG